MLFFSEDVKRPAIKYNKIKKCLFKILELEGKSPGEISIIFTSDKYLFEINKKYLDRDYLTDVISFNYYKEGLTEGDIYISLERVNENSRIYKVEFENELLRVIIHGLLHLIGFGDKSKKEKNIMTGKEDAYLKLYDECL